MSLQILYFRAGTLSTHMRQKSFRILNFSHDLSQWNYNNLEFFNIFESLQDYDWMTDVGKTKLYFRSFLVLFCNMGFQMRSIIKSIFKYSIFSVPWGLAVSDTHFTLRITRRNLQIKEKQLVSQVQTQSQTQSHLRSHLGWFTALESRVSRFLGSVARIY